MPALKKLHVKYGRLLACAPLLLLHGCGGGGNPLSSAVDDAAGGIATAFECTFLNCMESSSLKVEQIATDYTVTQNGSDVHVDAKLRKGSSFISTVLLSPGDALLASDSGQVATLVDISPQGQRMDYAMDFRDSQSQPTVTVIFSRAGVNYSSSVVVPPQFALLSANPQLSVTHINGDFDVQLGVTDITKLSNSVTGTCARVDGTSFTVQPNSINYFYVAKVTGGTQFHVRSGDIDATLNRLSQSVASPANESPVQTCNLQLAWIQTNTGTNSSAMSSASRIVGQTSVTQQINYYGQH